ncbi:MAG: zinc-binding dehydrogenase [Longispora sp.]|nr:zinc-binding dehydrogenase [Longispora sp. (in: high G+C Gram-positive bacteria)]
MRAAYVARIDAQDPLSGLEIGELPEPSTPDDWVTVQVKASSLNHHDLWTLRGVGLTAEALPMILGCDAAGEHDGRPVLVHAVLGQGEDETLDPKRSLLSEKYPGTIAERVRVPARNVVPIPEGMSFTDAACLPTAWLTAYRMLTTRGRLPKSGSVLVQGAGGGVATAAVVLARALGATVYATSRSAAKRARVEELGATAVEPGARLPERVDVVIETVGAATFDHSLKCAAPGGRIVVSGATSGNLPTVDLRRVYFLQLELVGSTMGTRDELVAMLDLMAGVGIRPVVDSVFSFSDARAAFERLHSGEAFGKITINMA